MLELTKQILEWFRTVVLAVYPNILQQSTRRAQSINVELLSQELPKLRHGMPTVPTTIVQYNEELGPVSDCYHTFTGGLESDTDLAQWLAELAKETMEPYMSGSSARGLGATTGEIQGLGCP